MDSESILTVVNDNLRYKDTKARKISAGMLTLGDIGGFTRGNFDPLTKIFFSHTSKDTKLMKKITLRWKDKKESTLTIYSKDITFGHYDFNLDSMPKKYLQIGLCGEMAKVVKVEHVVGRVTNFFTESGYFVIGKVLLHRNHNWLLSHTKYLNRLSSVASRIESRVVGSYLV